MDQLIGIEYPEEEGHEGQREEEAVDAVEDTTMTRDDIARVLDTDTALDHRLEEVTPRSGDRYDDTDIALLPAEEETRSDDSCDEPADEAFPALLR